MTAALTPEAIADLRATARQLLPASATPYELALAGGLAAAPLPVPLGDLWSPERCPLPLLAYLAWALSVDVWDEAWDEPVKRAVVRNAIALHRLKGTLEGIRRHVRLAGGEVVRAVVPPAKLFLGDTLTPGERRAFFARYPEIRITAVVQRGFGGGAFFPGPLAAGAFRRNAFPAGTGGPFLVDLGARERFGRRGFYVDGGTTVPLAIARLERDETGTPIDAFERLAIPGLAGSGFFADAVRHQRLLGETRSAERIVSLRIVNATEPQTAALRGGLAPVAVEPELVRERSVSRFGAFCGRLAGRFLVESRAAVSIYQSIRLFDAARALERRRAFTFLNVDRFGIDAFRAELDIAVRGRRPRVAFGRFVFGFIVEGDRAKEARVHRAIRAAKAARDTILVNTKISRPPTLGNDLFVGQVRVGEFVRG